MSRFHAVPYEDQSEINLSPMLDVVFILLIFFIVVASFIHEDGLPVTLPPGLNEVPPEFESITVIVGPASTFIVNGRAMSSTSVEPYVRALHTENPDATFGVVFAAGSKLKDAAVAIDAGRSSGFDVIPIAREE